MELQLSTDWTYRGLRVLILENRVFRVQILPEAGGKIWQITYKPTGTDLLWNNPRIPPALHSIHARYDDVWSGGWDELFPVDEEASVDGERYPDHGELWTAQWTAEPFVRPREVGVLLRLQTPISGITVEKTVVLKQDADQVFLHYRFANPTSSALPFLWKLHPAMQVSEHHRLDFPKMRVVREPAFPGTLEGAPVDFEWPFASTPHERIDLRKVTPAAAKQLYFFYGVDLASGWCALTNTASGLSCGLRFDSSIFPTCWLFASYGGWRGYNVAVLEPCTGYPLNFAALTAAGRHRVLGPGEVLDTDVLFTAEERHTSVASIEEDGRILDGPLARELPGS